MFSAYINGMGNISPQNTAFGSSFLGDPIYCEGNFLWAQEPDYKNYIQSGLVRRMGRIVRMSLAATHLAMEEAGVEQVDAILTGTAMGCLQDTEKFLSAIVENGEQMLTPTAFVQSTHNTIGGQIALLRQNTCYNLTYVHRGFSFESALLDALMRLKEGESACALVGGVDELTKNNEVFFKELGCVKSEVMNNEAILAQNRRLLAGETVPLSDGAQFGEGATFFVLSPAATLRSMAVIQGLKMYYKPSGYRAIEVLAQRFLSEIGWQVSDIDAVIMGNSGDRRYDTYYHVLERGILADKPVLLFKHLCGEYSTGTAFALWMGARVLQTQQIPTVVRGNNQRCDKIHKILIYNHHQGANHSFVALSVC